VYKVELLEHFRNPRNVGELPAPAIRVDVVNPACGDTLRLSVRWQDGRVAETAYRMRGCTAAIAAGSALTQWMLGKTHSELAGLRSADLDSALGGLPAESGHVTTLCLDAVRAVLRAA